MEIDFNPAESLLGVDLDNGWKVIELLKKKPELSGGQFSVSYIVEKSGTRAFLKALDLTVAFEDKEDFVGALNNLTTAFIFERELLYKCKNRQLSKIVTPLDHGQYRFSDYPDKFAVYYIIFDMAKNNLREQISSMKMFDMAWILRSLHHTAVGIKQLHQTGIAHQDLKPSNVLVFEKESKIADLGRSSDIYNPGPNDNFSIPGDRTYAPFELFYFGADMGTSPQQRYLIDLYHLGSLVFFYFLRTNLKQIIMTYLQTNNLLCNLTNKDFSSDLPIFQQGFAYAIYMLENAMVGYSKRLSLELIPLVKMLCEPDPKLRGHIANRNYDPYSLERFISRFDQLAKRAEYGVL